MKNLSLLLCSLLLNGVFGDEENKSVKEGDSVTLEINPEDINKAEHLVWKLNDRIIAQIDLEVKDRQPVYTDERFRDRLNLERQTGSLTITNIRSQHSGEYKLEIKRSRSTYKRFNVSVIEVIKVSLMEGDSLTLQTGVTDGKIDDVKWKLNGTHLNDSRFTNTEVKNQTGDLKIRNIRRDQSGEYSVEINGILHNAYSVNFNEVIKVSLMEGDSITLQTGVTGKIDDVKWKFNGTDLTDSNHEVKNQTGDLKITNIRRSGDYSVKINGEGFILHETYSVTINVKPESKSVSVYVGSDLNLCHDITDIQRVVIQWTFEGTLIAHSNRTLNNVPDRFSGRLSLKMTGCLIITNFGPEDSGLYEVNIAGSKHIIHKTFNVTGSYMIIYVAVSVVVVALLVVWGAYVKYKRFRKKKSIQVLSENEEELLDLEHQ